MNGSAEDVEAAALLCELRASPVVHTSALYSTPHARPSFSHAHDLRLPSPHEILAGREWERRPERTGSPLAPLAKRKRETEEAWPVQRPRPEEEEPAPPRRGYLSMSALGVLEAPPRKEEPPEERREWSNRNQSLPSLSDIRLAPLAFSDPRLPSSDARHWPPPRHPPDFALRTRTPSDLHAPSDMRSSVDLSDIRSNQPAAEFSREVRSLSERRPDRPADLRIADSFLAQPQTILSPYPTSALGLGVGLEPAGKRARTEVPTSTLVSTAGVRPRDDDPRERTRDRSASQFTQISPTPTQSRVRMPSFGSHPATSPVQSTHAYSRGHQSTPSHSTPSHSPTQPHPVRPTQGVFRAPTFSAGFVPARVPVQKPRPEPIEIEDSPEPEERPREERREERREDRRREEPRLAPSRAFDARPTRAPERPEPRHPELDSRRSEFDARRPDLDSRRPELDPRRPDLDSRRMPELDSRRPELHPRDDPRRPEDSRRPELETRTLPEFRPFPREDPKRDVYPRPRAPSEAIPRTPIDRMPDMGRSDLPRIVDMVREVPRVEPVRPMDVVPRTPIESRMPDFLSRHIDPSPIRMSAEAAMRPMDASRSPTDSIPRARSPTDRAPSETLPPRTPSDAASVPRVSSEGRQRPPEFTTDTEPPSSPLSEDETADEEGDEWEARRMEDRREKDGMDQVEIMDARVRDQVDIGDARMDLSVPREVEIHDVWETKAWSSGRMETVEDVKDAHPVVTHPVDARPESSRRTMSPVVSRHELPREPRPDPRPDPRLDTRHEPRIEPRHDPPPPTPSRLETLAQLVHGDMGIYPVNAPPAPKTIHHAPASSTPKSKPMLIGPTPKPRTSSTSRPKPAPGPSKEKEQDTGQIRCKCGSELDDRGPTVLCDGCGNWQHLQCYGLDEPAVSGRWTCGLCNKDGMDWVEEDKEEEKGTDVEMDTASVASVDGKGKEKVQVKKREPAKPKLVPRPSLSKVNPKAKPSNPLFPTTKPIAPTVRTITAPPKKTAKPATPKSATRPLSSSSIRPPTLKPKSVGSRPASIDPSPRVRPRPLSPTATPPAPQSPRASSPVEEPVAVETKPDDSERQSSPKLEKPEPSPVALHTALPPSSPRPPTPPAPSPPKPSAPDNDADDDDINAAHWATEYDHISANIVDASLRERLRSFGRDHLAKRSESTSTDITTLTPFTSSEPVFLASSQPTSLVRVKEIKPPPNQHTPTYGVLATGPIAQGALVLEYRCALSDAHAYMSNKAHQYALLGTGTKYVRLVPAPLDICLDARVMGNEGRFVRCGCWPNVVIRPFICEGEDQEPEARFGVFALRALELGEEIVLGWEWAVEHVVHKLVREEKLGPLSEDEDVLSDPDTKRLWDILDLLRSLSMTCACKPDSSNCALSFGRMLLEDADSVGHARDLGPLVGYKRQENGFEPTLHAVSSKTRRGRKSAGRDRKLKAAAPPPRVPTPPPKVPSPPVEATEPPVAAIPDPPREPTPPVAAPSPAKRALGKSVASPPRDSSETEPNDDDAKPKKVEKRGRSATVGRGKHKMRIESPSPEDDVDMESRAEPAVKTEVVIEPSKDAEVKDAEVKGTEEQVVEAPTVNQVDSGEESGSQGPEEKEPEPVSEVKPQDDASVKAPEAVSPSVEITSANQEPRSEHDGSPERSFAEPGLHDDTDHEEPKKVSFLDWARRRRATQAAETRDLIPLLDHMSEAPSDHRPDEGASPAQPLVEPDVAPTDTTVEAVPAVDQDAVAVSVISSVSLPIPPIEPPVASQPTDVAMQDVPPAVQETNVALPTEPFVPTEPHVVEVTTTEAMELDPDPPVETPSAAALDDKEFQKHTPSPPHLNGSRIPTASHTPLNHTVSLPDGPASNPEVPALVKRLSGIDFDPLKPQAEEKLASTEHSSHASEPSTQPEPSPPLPRPSRPSADGPEEGEITVPRAPASSYTPSNGSPATTSVSLPSGPRDRAPPTQPRKFSAGPPPVSSPSGSNSSLRPAAPPYPRVPPSGPSRGLSLSPRAPPSAPRADRRPYNPSPPTGPRDRERERERDRDRDRERDRDRDPRGRGRGFGPPPRGPSSDRGWRTRGGGRGGMSRGGSWRP